MYETVKKAHLSFSESKLTSSDVSFCPTNSPKPKNIQFTVIETFETLEKLTAENFWQLWIKNANKNSCQLFFC